MRLRKRAPLIKWLVALSILGGVVYPIILKPMSSPEYFKEIQKIGRKGIEQEKIQPGNMQVWRDPFKK